MIKTQPLRNQIRLWTIFLVIVPSLLIMAIYTMGQLKIARENSLELLDQRVSTEKRMIEGWMAERASVVREISKTEVFRILDKQQMKRTLDFKQENDANFDSLSYIDKEGIFQMSTLKDGIWYRSVNGTAYYQAALAGKEYISGAVIGRNSNLPIINFSSPIYDLTGHFQGVILGSIRMTRLDALLRESWIGQSGEILLVNSDGLLLNETRLLDILIAKGMVKNSVVMTMKISDDALHNIRLGEAGTATWISHLGHKVLGSYQPMPQQGWTLIGRIYEEEVLAPIYMQLTKMAVGTVVLLLLILPLANRINNRFKRPIKWLIDQSELVATGKYQMVGRDDFFDQLPRELGFLCETFVKMSSHIENNIGLIKENKEKLGRKVREIQKINASLQAEIRERQAAEEALRQANYALYLRNKENGALLDAVPDLIFEIDNTGVVRSARGTRVKFFKPPNEQIGMNISEFLPSEVCQILMENISKALTTNSTSICQFGLDIDGETVMREARIISYKENETLVLVRNITDEIRAEQKNIEITRLLEQGQRLAALGIMATSIAHELNQPLNSIKISSSGVIYTLKNKVPRTEADLLKEFERIVAEVDRADNIIKNIRKFVKEDYSNRYSINLANVIGQAIKTLEHQRLFQDITIKPQIQYDLSSVLANDLHLEQVIINLLMNAAQALVGSAQSSKIIGIKAWFDGQVILEIWDNGPGLLDEIKSKVFEPFFSTKENTKSMGLGLAIVQTIVGAYGGKIGVYDNDHGGATFRMEFPPEKEKVPLLKLIV